MPGTPINSNQSEINQLQVEEPKEVQQNENLPVRELTQTDVLNKRLLVSFFKKINECDEGLRDSSNEEPENNDISNSDFLEC